MENEENEGSGLNSFSDKRNINRLSLSQGIVPYPSPNLSQTMKELAEVKEVRERERDENQREVVLYAKRSYHIAIAAIIISATGLIIITVTSFHIL